MLTRKRIGEITELVHNWMAKSLPGFVRSMEKEFAEGKMESDDSVERSVADFLTSWGFIYQKNLELDGLAPEIGVSADELWEWMEDVSIKPGLEQRFDEWARKFGRWIREGHDPTS